MVSDEKSMNNGNFNSPTIIDLNHVVQPMNAGGAERRIKIKQLADDARRRSARDSFSEPVVACKSKNDYIQAGFSEDDARALVKAQIHNVSRYVGVGVALGFAISYAISGDDIGAIFFMILAWLFFGNRPKPPPGLLARARKLDRQK